MNLDHQFKPVLAFTSESEQRVQCASGWSLEDAHRHENAH